MAGNLNAGFSNNINVISLRVNGVVDHIYTDRTIDFDGDGTLEAITETHVSGHAGSSGGKVSYTVTVPTGWKRTLVKQTNETDGGVDTTGSEFTEGVA